MRSLWLISVFILASFASRATHIVGGGFSLKWISGDNYELYLRVLRDCQNGVPPFNDPLSVGTFDRITHQPIDTFVMQLLKNETLSFVGPNCASIPTGCTEVGYYKRIIQLPAAKYKNNDGYYFSWERCCRNDIIQNIVKPEDAGMTFYMEIPPPKFIKNSTPEFTNNPVTLLCMNNPFTYNMKFVDPDNDSLHYSLVEPLQGTLDQFRSNGFGTPLIYRGPYPTINWRSGYGNNNELNGAPPLSIHPLTGELTVTPSEQGIFVASILVEEFRFGKKLGEVRLELQFTVTTCFGNPFPAIQYYDQFGLLTPGMFTVQIPDSISFEIVTLDAQDSLELKITGPYLDSVNMLHRPYVTRHLTGLKKISTRFGWQSGCELTGMPPQTYTVEVKDNGCPIPKKSISTFTIFFKPMPTVNSTDILCMSLDSHQTTTLYYGDSTPDSDFFTRYVLFRSTNDSAYVPLDSISDKSQREYQDLNSPNNTQNNYSYYMRGMNKCGFFGPPSDTLATFDQLKAAPDEQKLITVTVEDNARLRVMWPQTKEKDFARYFLFKGTRDQDIGSFVPVYETLRKNDTTFIDPTVDVQNTSACYYLMMKDTCNNFSPVGKRACSIVLKGISYPFEHLIEWQPYLFWEVGTDGYEVHRRHTEAPDAIVDNASDVSSAWLDRNLDTKSGKYWYYITARERSGSDIESYNAESRSNEISLIQAPLLHVPNAFTANNDQVNDQWGIRDVFVKDYHLKIYNGWGQLVFETKDKNVQWTGNTDDGVLQQSSVYVYVITFTGWDDSSHTRKGNVTILR